MLLFCLFSLFSLLFVCFLMKISEYFNFGNSSPDLVDTGKVTMFLQLMKQKYISYWQHTLQHSQKLEFYRSFKNEYATSSYLELTRRVSDRRTLTKLRISNQKLMIELGRYSDTPRDNRLCPVCDCNQTEDEIHFLFYCSKYATTRDNFYKKIPEKIQPFIQNVRRLPVHCQKFGSKWRTRVRVASLMAAESCEKMYGISTKIQNKTNTS